MELFLAPHEVALSGPEVRALATADGVALRAALWSPQKPRATVVIAQGRGEFIEKYYEVVSELLARGFVVVAFDWRGQGGSDRLLANPRKGHIDDFSHYLRDLDALEAQVLAPSCPKPWFGLGHSMGGAILLMHAHERGEGLFGRLMLSAPMVGLASLRFPDAVRWMAGALNLMGFGGAYVPGGSDTGYLTRPFDGNALTSDPGRFAAVSRIASAAPHLTLGSPTIGWLHAAFRLMEAMAERGYPESIVTPTLMVIPGADRVVSSPAAERFALAMKAGYRLEVAQARHEVLIERDAFRTQFWAAFDAFIPGNLAEQEALAP